MHPKSWLFLNGPDKPIFSNKDQIMQRFTEWTRRIFPAGSYDESAFLTQYRAGRAAHRIDISLPLEKKSTPPIYVKIYEDLMRTLGCLRTQLGVASLPEPEDWPFLEAILRMIIFMHETDSVFRYRQTMIELLLPVYHAVWCYMTRVQNVTSTDIIESVAVATFQTLMRESKHIESIPGSETCDIAAINRKIDEQISRVARKVGKLLDSKKIEMKQACLMKWFFLIFTQDFKFEDVLLLWDHLIGSGMANFENELAVLCANVLKRLEKKLKSAKDEKEITDILQSVSQHVSAKSIIQT